MNRDSSGIVSPLDPTQYRKEAAAESKVEQGRTNNISMAASTTTTSEDEDGDAGQGFHFQVGKVKLLVEQGLVGACQKKGKARLRVA